MIRVLFVCHGNICRSTMAQFVSAYLAEQSGMADAFYIASAATSREEIGNPVHPGTTRKLRELGISTKGKYAVQMTKKDYEKYDYLIGMETWNIRNINRIVAQTRTTRYTGSWISRTGPGILRTPGTPGILISPTMI